MIRAALFALVFAGCCTNARQQAINELEDCRWKFERDPRLTTQEKADLYAGCEALFNMRMEELRR